MIRRAPPINPSSGELSMSITVSCQCGKRLRVADNYAGRRARCPQCGNVLQIPAAEPSSEETDRQPATEFSPTQAARSGGKARWIGIAVVVLVASIGVYRYSTAGKASKPGAESSPLAVAPSAEDEVAALPEEPVADTTEPEPALEVPVPDQAAPPRDSASARGTDKPAAPPAPRRSTSRLLQGFVPMLEEDLAAYRDYELTAADLDLVNGLLSDEELVGDGAIIQSSYPPPAVGLWDWDAIKRLSQAEGETATLNIYTQGKGLTLEMLKARFGPPRLEKNAFGILCATYGNTGVIFGKDNEFLGVVSVVFPEREGADQDQLVTEMAAAPEPPAAQAPSREPGPELAPRAKGREPRAESDWGPAYPLEYQDITELDDPLAMLARRYLYPTRRSTRNYRATLGGRQITLAVEGGATPTLRVDTNFNGRLSDEQPVPGTRLGSGNARAATYRFGPISIRPPQNDDGEPVQFFIQTAQAGTLTLYPARCRVGEVRIDGESWQVALMDCNFDGRYDDVCKLPLPRSAWSRFDGIAVDRNRNKRFDPGGAAQWEIQPLTRMIGFGDKHYLVRVAPDGSALQCQPADIAMGTLDIKRAGVELLVLGDAGVFRLAGHSQWRLPEGRYSCWSVVLFDIGPRGPTGWQLPGTGSFGKLADFQIRGNQTTQLPVGVPLIARATVAKPQVAGRSKVISVGVKVVDSSGVEYAIAAERGNQKLPAPAFRILSKWDTPIYTGKFTYG